MSELISSVINSQRAESLALLTEEALINNHVEAERLARELVEIMQILHGAFHIEVGIAQFYLALALEEQGKIQDAIAVRKKARKILLGHGICRN